MLSEILPAATPLPASDFEQASSLHKQETVHTSRWNVDCQLLFPTKSKCCNHSTTLHDHLSGRQAKWKISNPVLVSRVSTCRRRNYSVSRVAFETLAALFGSLFCFPAALHVNRHRLCGGAHGEAAMVTNIELQGTEAERPSSPARTSHPVASVRPSTKYVEVEGPNKRFLRQALAPPRPVLPRKQARVHSPPTGLRERIPLLSSLTG